MSQETAPQTQVERRTMTPLGDTVALEMLPEAALRASGLWLPDGARVRYDAAKLARVLDVGPLVREGLCPGDEVLITPFHDGVEVTIPGVTLSTERVRLVQERAVVAIVSKERPLPYLMGEARRALEAMGGQDAAWTADFLQAEFTALARRIADASVAKSGLTPKVWR